MAQVKRSEAYRAIRAEVSDPIPQDSWLDDTIAFVVFGLRAKQETSDALAIGQAVFALDTTSGTLLAARRIEPQNGAAEPRVENLLVQRFAPCGKEG